jgi:6-phosphogluconolactonase
VIGIFSDAAAAAEAIVDSLHASVRAAPDRLFRIGLSGGRSPLPLYQRLARDANRALDWTRAEVLFADERAVPPDHPDSNYRLIEESLLRPLRVPDRQVRRMRAESEDLEAAAREYESWLETPLDFLVLGMGPDGHVASIFPGAAAAREHVRRVVAVRDSPKPPARRLTVTPRVLGEARVGAVLAFGAEKSDAAAAALEGAASADDLPARGLRDRDWYLDRESAAGLARRPEDGAVRDPDRLRP